jgi:hypothetical protein
MLDAVPRRPDHSFGVARRFTVEEANALLPTVPPLVQTMVEQRRELLARLERQQALGHAVGSNGGGFDPRTPAEIDAAVETAAAEVGRCVEELTALGLQVKDLDTGLVDFPSVRDGEQVLLCWLLGEEEVAWWHTLDGGFAGRRPL